MPNMALQGTRDASPLKLYVKRDKGNPSLNRRDGIHPTAEGYRIITENIYPFARQAIEGNKKLQ